MQPHISSGKIIFMFNTFLGINSINKITKTLVIHVLVKNFNAVQGHESLTTVLLAVMQTFCVNQLLRAQKPI